MYKMYGGWYLKVDFIQLHSFPINIEGLCS